MRSKKSLACTILFLAVSLSAIPFAAYPGLANYTYDEGNRLIRIDYEDGSKIEYSYDETGNRTVKQITAADHTAPVTTATPPGGTYASAQNITLTCDDGDGSGCDRIFYTTDGSEPTTTSSVYSAAIAISATTTLKFFAIDLAGNHENIKTQTYTITAGNQLQVTVGKDAQNPLQSINIYLFSGTGTYLGQAKVTDASGQAAFSVGPGTYKIRADYLGYRFWSDPVQVEGAGDNVNIAIPHQTVNISVNASFQGTQTPIPGINVYLFTPAGSYLGVTGQTAADGRVAFSLPAKDYKVRADYLEQQYFSAVFNAQDASVAILMAEAEITATQQGQPINGISIYAFTPANSYLGIHGTTNASGKVTFRLPASAYKFRADYLGNQYWSSEETHAPDQTKPIAIETGGGPITLTVLKDASNPIAGIKCYLFNETGTYLGLSGTLDSSGQAAFNLPTGSYKFRVDYLESQFWTEIASVPTITALTKTIEHRNVTITIKGVLGGSEETKSGINVYLFTQAGSYLGTSAKTGAAGQVVFNLPQQPFKVRADYMGMQFWSDVFTWEDKAVVIPEGTARDHVTMAGQDLPSVPVYVFSAAGSYLGLSGTTDAAGIREFRLPAGDYKFRADYLGNQYWATASIAQNTSTPIEINAGGGQFTLSVLKTASDPISGVKCYLFNAAGSYLGLSGTSDANGLAAFNLPNGNYKFRVDYLGYQFWTDLFTIPNVQTGAITIPHQDSTILIQADYPSATPLAGVSVYLFTPSGSYLGTSQKTDASGQAAFNLPNKSYKVRADYLGSQYWSNEFQFTNATVTIPRGTAQVIVKKAGNPVQNANVYVFSEGGSYLGLSAVTNAEGKAEFLLPGKSYKFRVDSEGGQHWSAVTAITAGQVDTVEVVWE